MGPGLNEDTLMDKNRFDSMGNQIYTGRLKKTGVGIQLHEFNELADSGRVTVRDLDDSLARRHNIFIRVKSDDTLSMDALRRRFETVIDRSAYPYEFQIRHVTALKPVLLSFTEPDFPPFDPRQRRIGLRPFSDTLTTERAMIGPVHSYFAVFPSMRSNVIKKIMPQILFSVFLTTITIAAFVVMYRNLRTQERVMQMKNDFIGNVTHELKTPIATVSVALEALKDFHALKNPARTAEYLDIAQHELNRLSLMTDKILNASVFEQQGVAFIPGVVKLDEIVKQVTESLKVVLDKKNIQTSVSLHGSSFELKGSEMHLTNVVFNLLDNAIKYSAANTSIEISLRSNEQEINLAIQDHGMGIDKLYHKKIFEKFFRVQQGDVHNTKGHGLGLNYVADVVHSHRGDISIESSLGQGSCFTLRLPRNAG